MLATVRNQGAIVDNYSLVVHGFPQEWCTIIPETVYLVPLGAKGSFEQEVEIHLHPPRDPGAEARRWELRVGVYSHAAEGEIASAPMTLGIHPYEDCTVRVRPERATGRRFGKFDVTVVNNANAVTKLALDARDNDDACRFDFERDTVELRPGQSKVVPLRCRPPRQIWIGRPRDRFLQILAAGGEAGEQLLIEKEEAKASATSGGGLKQKLGAAGMPKLPGVSGPKVNMPRIGIGPGGKPNIGMPNVRGPQFRGVNLRRPTMGLKALKMPGGQAPPEVEAKPLLPTQAVFRQKAWLPWWLAIVVPLLILLLILLYLLWPKPVERVAVPKLVGEQTSEAENKLDDLKLVLGSRGTKANDSKVGVILSQHPKPGTKRDVGSKVNIVVGTGTGTVLVPDLAGQTLAPATEKLIEVKLTRGAVTPADTGLTAKITHTIPEAGASVKEGQPVDIYYVKPAATPGSKPGGGKPGEEGGAGGGGGGGAAAGGPVTIPKIDPKDQQGYGKVLGDLGLAPDPAPAVNDAPIGTVFATVPAVGTTVDPGTTVRMLVSAGYPSMVFDNDDNVKRVTGGGGVMAAIAKSDAEEKDPTWAPDRLHVVYTSDGQLTVANVRDIDQDRAKDPVTLTSGDTKYRDPLFAPTGTDKAAPVPGDPVLVFARRGAKDDDLCFARLKLNGEFNPRCITDDKVTIGTPRWMPGGKQILVPASEDGRATWGVLLYESEKPYSADAGEWEKKGFADEPGKKYTIDLAMSPDGKWLAAASNLHGNRFALYLTTEPFDNIKLANVDPQPINACKVTWIDNTHLAIVKFGPDCSQTTGTGEIARLSVDKPKKQTTIVDSGDNPSFRPLPGG